MNIDWFTLAAQMVNFLILVVLLRWLLYGRIVAAMNEREEKIANRFQQADQKQAEAEEIANEYEAKTQRLDEQREELFQETHHEVAEEKKQMLQDARDAVERKRDQWQDAYERERDELLADVRRQASRMGLATARRTLSQLANAELETRMCDAFAEQLRDLDEGQRTEITRHLADGEREVSIGSVFDIPDQQRRQLSEAIRETFEYDQEVAFQTSPDLVCGLELEANGYRFGWNMNDYLADLEAELDERLGGR